MNRLVACPDARRVERFLLGQLPDDEVDSMAQHLLDCPRCFDAARSLDVPDLMVETLQGGKETRLSEQPGVPELMERLKSLEAALPATVPPDDFLAPAETPEELGRLGAYRILKVLGQGGMGTVFEAEDPQLRRRIALKVIRPDRAQVAVIRERFLREARALAAVRHDHIVTIHHVGEERGVSYLTMELLEGETLQSRLDRDGPLPLAEVIRIGRQIAEGLAAAHARGLIHRDIKPGNVWLEKGSDRVKILDFGLTRAGSEELRLTQERSLIGTPGYMAPEQARGEAVDERCDLFSLGCILYVLATGKPPFEGDSLQRVMWALECQHPKSVRTLNPKVPATLAELIEKLLAKAPQERPGSAVEVVRLLDLIGREYHRKVATPGRTPSRLRLLALASLAALGLLYTFGPVLFLIGTNQGQLVIDVKDRAVQVRFSNGETVLVDAASKRTFTLKAGETEIEVIEDPDGVRLFTKKFTLTRGGRELVNVQLEAANATRRRTFTNSIGMKFVLVPRGRFLVGGGDGELGKPAEIPHDFYLGVYEVTQGEWKAITGVNPNAQVRQWSIDAKKPVREVLEQISEEELLHFPVAHVSWDDVQRFVKVLNALEKDKNWEYRLPTSLEWEYACRGGPTPNDFEYGFNYYFDKPTNELLPSQANFDHPKGLKRPCKVGSYKPNRLGLYDMHGNVWEWCQDAVKPGQGEAERISRGGSFQFLGQASRAAFHEVRPPSYSGGYNGLRLARVPVGSR